MRIVALDLGLRTTDWCEVKDGVVIARGRVGRVQELVGVLGPNQPPARVGFEACREAWAVNDRLREWGNEPVMLDTTRVRAIGVGSHGRKNDRMDAEVLAIALERGHVALAHVLSQSGRQLREALEKHRALTETRKRLVTHARGLARGRGILLPSCATEDFAKHLRESRLPDALESLLEPLLPPLEHVTYQLAAVDLEVQQLCKAGSDPVLDRLASIPGVSVLSAAAFMSVIDDVRRFRHASDVVAYIGLCPSERSSGGKQRLGAITKRGNSYVRWMLVQSAWCILRRRDGDPLAAWGQAVAKRRGRMRAAVAVARRLARVLFSLWRDGTYYDPKTFSADKWGSADEAAERQQLAATRAKAKLERQQRTRQQTPEPVATQEVNA